MICPVCHGIGHVTPEDAIVANRVIRCGACGWPICPNPACHGGIVHCCEGERSQPEPQEKGDG